MAVIVLSNQRRPLAYSTGERGVEALFWKEMSAHLVAIYYYSTLKRGSELGTYQPEYVVLIVYKRG